MPEYPRELLDKVTKEVMRADHVFGGRLLPARHVELAKAALHASGIADLAAELAHLVSCAPADCEMTRKARALLASLSGGENVR